MLSFLLLPFSSFFLYFSGSPRDLHSFPTRRSSDLHGIRPKRHAPTRAASPRISGATSARSLSSRWSRDRKSTRLNSSHLGISYAVFCLKKKKKINIINKCREKIGYTYACQLDMSTV